MQDAIKVEVVYATPSQQSLIEIALDSGATIDDALRLSGIYAEFPDTDFAQLESGIWGKPAARSTVVRDGDRIELYRPLKMDPRVARRERARG